MAKPTFRDLIAAGAAGLKLRNPDNGVEFRAVHVNVYGVTGVKLYRGTSRRADKKSPIMSNGAIESWLAGLEFCGAAPTQPAEPALALA